jgi:hypothetical protein
MLMKTSKVKNSLKSILLLSIGILGLVIAVCLTSFVEAQEGGDYDIYLPIVNKPQPVNPFVKLISPENNAQLDTLIPEFAFETVTVPDDLVVCLAYSSIPNPTDCRIGYWLKSNMNVSTIVSYNLQPNTTYYWRMGTGEDFDNLTSWTEQRTFVSGPAGGVFLSPPELVSPADHSGVNPDTVTLKWNPVAGAVEYYILIYDKFGNQRFGVTVPGSETQVGPDRLQWIFDMASGGDFEWSMTVRNDYAWATSSSPVWHFWTTSSKQMVRQNNLTRIMEWEIFDGEKIYLSEKNNSQ